MEGLLLTSVQREQLSPLIPHNREGKMVHLFYSLDLISNLKHSRRWFLWKLIAVFFQVLGLLLLTCPPIHTWQFYKTVQHLQKPLKCLERVWYLIKFFVSSPTLWNVKMRSDTFIFLSEIACLTTYEPTTEETPPQVPVPAPAPARSVMAACEITAFLFPVTSCEDLNTPVPSINGETFYVHALHPE